MNVQWVEARNSNGEYQATMLEQQTILPKILCLTLNIHLIIRDSVEVINLVRSDFASPDSCA